MQQSFRSRRNTCAAVFPVPYLPYRRARFLVFSKAIQSQPFSNDDTAPRASFLVTYSSVSWRRRSELFGPVCSLQVLAAAACTCVYSHPTFSLHPVFRLFSTVYDQTIVRTSDVSFVPYEIFQNFKFNMTYCTYMSMPDFYARFTVRPSTSATYRTR